MSPPAARPVDDVTYWAGQMADHAELYDMLLQDSELRSAARRTGPRWRSVAASSSPRRRVEALALIPETAEYKQRVLQRLMRGEWVGWALPSFVEHTLGEVQYMQARLEGRVDERSDLHAWLALLRGYPELLPKLVDPRQTDFARRAEPIKIRLAALQRLAAGPVGSGDMMLLAADRAFAESEAWCASAPLGMHAIPPLLAAHVAGEHARARHVVRSWRKGGKRGGSR